MSKKPHLKKSTTSLPAALRDELGLSEPGESRGKAAFSAQGYRRGGGVVGRKEARKAQRQEKRLNRRYAHSQVRPTTQDTNGRGHHQSAAKRSSEHPTDVKGKSKAVASPSRLPQTFPSKSASSRFKTQQLGVHKESATPLQLLLNKQDRQEDSSKRYRSTEDTKEPHKKRVRTTLSATEKAEEDEIAWLEAHLGSSQSTDESRVGPDGLDELLEDLDRFYPGMYEDESRSDESDTGEEQGTTSDEDEESVSEDYSDIDEREQVSLDDDDDGEGGGESTGDEYTEDDHDDAEASKAQKYADESPSVPVSAAGTVSATSSVTSRYVPPALRKKIAAEAGIDTEQMTKLRRSIKGLLNRLGENNLESIVGGLEEIYRDHSRAPTTATLTEIIMETIASSENMTDSFVILYATVAAAMHRIIGIEFGAHFIEQLIERFLRRYRAECDRLDVSKNLYAHDELAKEPRSLASLLAALYNLDIVASPLMYDVTHLLLGLKDPETGKDRDDARALMTELDIEILLGIVKLCGSQLRHDDPTSLKQIVHLAQESQSSHSDSQSSLRAKFMLESLSDLRNNRSRATTASVAAESTSKMKKYLSGLAKKHTIRTQEPLRVGLQDLCSADKRGKWWLVGAAWSGYEFNKEQADDKGNGVEEALDRAPESQNEQLQKLARQHGMNTLIRQQIFTTLMTSQDYLDAVQRLMSLTHKKTKQRREIVRVLLHCLGHEQTFNPYYVVVGSRLASEDQMGTRITLQYCLWDYLRRLGEQKVGGQSIVSGGHDFDHDKEEDEDGFGGLSAGPVNDADMHNTARAYGWWFAKGSLGLDALRAVDFTALKRNGARFISLTFVYIFLSVGTSSPVQTLSDLASANDPTLSQKGKESLEKTLVLGTRTNRQVAKGLLVFLQTRLRAKDCKALAQELGLGKILTDLLIQRQQTALETLRVGVQMAGAHEHDDG